MNSVLGNVVNKLGLDKGLKQQEFAKLWPKIVGPKFQNSSKAAYIYSRNGIDTLMVAVSSSMVAQELSFFKEDILKKIKKVSQDFEIKDIFFNPKLWEEIKQENNTVKKEENNPKFYKIEKSFSEKEIKNIKLSDEIIQSVKNSLEEQNFYSEELKEKMFNTIIKDLKIREWQKNNGFPICSKCGIPVNYYSPESENFCPICKFK